MGDLIAVFQHLNLSPVNSILLAVIVWLVWRLYQRFDLLEGQCGIIQQLREQLAEHHTSIEVSKQRIANLEEKE